MRRSSHAPEMDFGYATSVDDIFDTPAKSHDDWTADDVEEGQGTFIFANGDRYEGRWNNGERGGKGRITRTNGDVQEVTLLKEEYGPIKRL